MVNPVACSIIFMVVPPFNLPVIIADCLPGVRFGGMLELTKELGG